MNATAALWHDPGVPARKSRKAAREAVPGGLPQPDYSGHSMIALYPPMRDVRSPTWLEEQLAQANPDLLRAMVSTFAEALMGAEADAVCGAGYGERSEQRTNTRNGYRPPAASRSCGLRPGSPDASSLPSVA